MKKLYLVLCVCIFTGFFAFADTNEQEELGFLLFSPNSSVWFADENQARSQLDAMAAYLADRNLLPGQILVQGFTATAANDIEPLVLSRERALFIIDELHQRGVSRDLFLDPVGLGNVDLWGSNIDEQDMSPNRRVRVLIVPPALVAIVAADPVPAPVPVPVQQDREREPRSGFPWWLLLIPLLGLLALLLAKRKKRPVVAPVVAAAPVVVPIVITNEEVLNLEEEIRFRAYELYLARNGQSENAVEDWHIAVPEVCARYEVKDYQTYPDAGSWWASKTTVTTKPQEKEQ